MANAIGLFGRVVLIVLISAQLASADRITRLSEVKRGEVSDFSVVSLSANYTDIPGGQLPGFFRSSDRFVIAMRDSENKLRLMVWELPRSGNLKILANTATEGTIKKVSVTRVASNRVVTAVRDSGDNLRLIVWDILNNGKEIKRRGTRTAGKIEDVDIAGEPDFTNESPHNGRVFTAARDTNGNLAVAEWIVMSNGNLRPPITKVYGPVSQFDVESSEEPSYIISAAMRDSEDKLRLISFTEGDTEIKRRNGLGKGAEISFVKTSGFAFSGGVYTVTISEGPIGIRTGLHGEHRLLVDAGLLKVIHWNYEATPGKAPIDNNPDRKSESEVTATDGLAVNADIVNLLLSIGTVDAEVVTAHTGFGTYKKLLRKDQGKPRLHLIAWDQDLKKTAQQTLGGDYTQVEMVPVRPFNDVGRFITVVRGVRGELKIVAWSISP